MQAIWLMVKNYSFNRNNNKLTPRIVAKTASLTHLFGVFAMKFPPIIDNGKNVKTNNPFDFSGVMI